MWSRLRGSLLLCLLGLAGIGVAIVASGLQHVRPGAMGLGAKGVEGPGWVWNLPWSRLKTLPRTGRLELPRISLHTREGSRFEYELAADYTLGPSLDPTFVAEIRKHGLGPPCVEIAQVAFDQSSRRWDAETLLSDRTLLESAVAAGFQAVGLLVSSVVVHSAAEETVARRRKTAEAQALQRPMTSRVLVIGLDGADWNLARPLIAAGRLPNLGRLAREGAHGPLRSYDPMFSPLLWTTVATGKSPDKHGIADFLVKDEASGSRRPISSDFRRVKALWNIFGDFGIEAAWIAWWATYPAERIDGVMITEMLAHTVVRSGAEAAAQRAGLVWPEGFLASRADRLVPPSRLSYEDVQRLFPLTRQEFSEAQRRAALEEPDPDAKEPPDPVVLTVKLLCAMRTYHNLALDLLREDLPFVAVYYEGIDMMGHRFQHYLPPRMALVSNEEFSRFAEAVEKYYELQDEMIGELIEAAGPNTTTVVLSDHGFASGSQRPTDVAPYTTGQPAEWHRPWGMLILHGPGIRRGSLPPASLYDLAPTLLYLAGLPLAEDMPGQLIQQAFEGTPAGIRSGGPIRSYELIGSEPTRGEPAPVDPVAFREMLANLRALGYIGGDVGGEPADAPLVTAADGIGNAGTQVFYHRNLATYHMKQGNLAEAERELLLANERQPFPKTYAMLAEVRAAGGRFGEAASALEEGWRTIPDRMEPRSVLWVVEMRLRQGDRDAATAALRSWGANASSAVRAAAEGRLRDDAGDRNSAASFYEQALAQDPLLVHIALRLHDLYQSIGQAQRIVPILEQGLRREPRTDAYHDLLGELARERGDWATALRHFREACELVPENGRYLGHRALAAAALGQTAEALDSVAWAKRWATQDPQAWLSFGSALDRLGRADDAVEAFRKSAELRPDDPRAALGMALALARSGRRAEARRVVDEAQTRFPNNEAIREFSRRLGG